MRMRHIFLFQVVCKNKLEGKQKAAQCMLKILHPQLKSWASILRLYSKNTEVGFQERVRFLVHR